MMSTARPVDVTPAAPLAGADLRLARERLGWALEDVAQSLRIRISYLEALEEGRLSVLPGNAYALAFVRSYAQLLGVDAEEMVRRFKAEAADVSRRTELVFPVPMPERGLPAGAIMLLGLVLVIAAYAGWYRLSGEGKLPAEAVVPVPERLAAAAGLAVPHAATATAMATPGVPGSAAPEAGVPGTGAGVPGAGVSAAAEHDQDKALDTRDGTPAPAAVGAAPQVPASIAAEAVNSPMSAAAAPMPAPAYRPDAGGPAAQAPASASEPRIVLQAKADAWILVKDHAGAVLLKRVLKTGDSWPVPARPDLVMTTGNAGGTEVLVDGTATPALGGFGAVRHDIALDPEALKTGRQATVAAAPAVRGRQ